MNKTARCGLMLVCWLALPVQAWAISETLNEANYPKAYVGACKLLCIALLLSALIIADSNEK